MRVGWNMALTLAESPLLTPAALAASAFFCSSRCDHNLLHGRQSISRHLACRVSSLFGKHIAQGSQHVDFCDDPDRLVAALFGDRQAADTFVNKMLDCGNQVHGR